MNNSKESSQLFSKLAANRNTNSMFYGMFRFDIADELIETIGLEDLKALHAIPAYFLVTRWPALGVPIETDIPSESKLVILDLNFLMRFDKEQRIAIVLHEIGHLFNPGLSGDTNEFKADDYVVEKGFGAHLKANLEESIELYAHEFDKPITYKRIDRL